MKCLTGKTRGTCDLAECPMHGLCHTCGKPTKHSPSTSARRDRRRGMPFIRHAGHHPHGSSPGCWGTRGIDRERIDPLLDLLVRRHGSIAEVSRITGINSRTLASIWQRRTKRCGRPTAQAIVDAVRALRRGHDPLATFEVPARLPTPAERDEARREAARIERARYRRRETNREAS